MVSEDGSKATRLRWTSFVSCVSDHESGYPQVSMVTIQPFPSILNVFHTEATGTERSKGEGAAAAVVGVVVVVLVVGGEQTMVGH